MAKNRPTAAHKRRFAKLAGMGCIICGLPGEIHHCRFNVGMGQRNHEETVCLCEPGHHRNGHGGKIAYHQGKIDFEETYGTEKELLEETNRRIE